MNPSFAEVYELLLWHGPGRAISNRGTQYRIEARSGKIVAFPKSGRISVHEDCWGQRTTCQGTRAGGLYTGPYSIFDWFAEHQSEKDHAPLSRVASDKLPRPNPPASPGGKLEWRKRTLLDEHAADYIAAYNGRCVHYNLIAEGVYRARRRIGDHLSQEYEPFIIAGLLGFDMGRTMGQV
jgi:hypothetical protein